MKITKARMSTEADQFVLLHSLLQGPNPLQINCHEDFQNSDAEWGSSKDEETVRCGDSLGSKPNTKRSSKRWQHSKAESNPTAIVPGHIGNKRRSRYNAREAFLRRSSSLRSVGSYYNTQRVSLTAQESASNNSVLHSVETERVKKAAITPSVPFHRSTSLPVNDKSTCVLSTARTNAKLVGRSSSLRSTRNKRNSKGGSAGSLRSSSRKNDDDASLQTGGKLGSVLSESSKSRSPERRSPAAQTPAAEQDRAGEAFPAPPLKRSASNESQRSSSTTSSCSSSSRVGVIRKRNAVRRCNSDRNRNGGHRSVSPFGRKSTRELKRSNTDPASLESATTTTTINPSNNYANDEMVDDSFLSLVKEGSARRRFSIHVEEENPLKENNQVVKRQPVEWFRGTKNDETKMAWERRIQCHSISSDLSNWLS